MKAAPKRPRVPEVKLVVTQEMVDEAEARHSSHCMWAEALKAAVPGARKVSVDLQTIRFTDPVKPLRYIYLTPRHAQVELVKFDQGQHVSPSEVTLRGGQVVRAATKTSRALKGSEGVLPSGRASLKVEKRGGHGGSSVPDKIGGEAPPMGPLANAAYGNQRRAFGLRALAI